MKNKFDGIKFKKIRERYGLTQLELADKVNEKYGKAVVDASSISRWEINPNAVPRNNKLVKVAETLGVSVDIFYNGSNVKTKIWWEFNEPDISKSFCYATHVVKAE